MTATLPPETERSRDGASAAASTRAAPLSPAGSHRPIEHGARERLLSLDVFRGVTVAAMLLVNNPGSWGAIYPPLEHAEWNGWTPTDLIFPFFLFIVGITTHLSMEARRARGDDDGALVRQVLRRGALIVLLGLLMSAYPFYPLDRITTMRFPGVLQRIGVAYTFAALLTLRTSLKTQLLIVVALLYGYWFAMTLVPVPGRGIGALLLDDPSASLAAWIDRAVFGVHLWKSSRTWDPEGLFSTVPAIASVILGVFAGRWLATPRPIESRLVALFGVGAICMVAGLMWGWSFPINKSLWTSSYVLFAAGTGGVALATCIWVIDVSGVRWWTTPFLWYGMNPMVAFVGSGMMARTIYSLVTVPRNGERVPIQRVIYEDYYLTWLEPRDASLLFAVTFVIVWAGVLGTLYRKRIFFKV